MKLLNKKNSDGSLSLSNSLLSEGSNDHLERKSSEEEDHLQRSTKKVKETIVGDDDTMLNRPITKAQTEPPEGKSIPADGKSRSTPFKSFKAPCQRMMISRVRVKRSKKMKSLKLNLKGYHASQYPKSFWLRLGGHGGTALILN